MISLCRGEMNDDSGIDHASRLEFEEAWIHGRPRPIDEFLPAPEKPGYIETLEELVLIELEFGWKRCRNRHDETQAAERFVLEKYQKRFPRLRTPDITRRLLAQEYQMRHRFGDRPSVDLYQERFPEIAEPQSLDSALESSLASFPRIPGYEISAVLGRGGMGVVYLARQDELNRFVALKTLLLDSNVDGSHAERFRAEAETVGQLQHPNIIQVYEIGSHNGQPFFSLELVDGGSLTERTSTPQGSRSSAKLVSVLASAIHDVHLKGIIHRDLKPSNILVTDDGTPKITDFGLAKWLEADSSFTKTGELMGTPSYMAPEQARGEVDRIGPSTDVFALGAILYELLTGRPPFRGETSWDTISQVLDQDPVPPRALQPRVEQDLETICLKCLHKAPGSRYTSALELADDLNRYIRREPIKAKRTGWAGRASRWCDRNRALAASLIVSTTAIIALVIAGFWSVMSERDRFQQERDRAESLLADLAWNHGMDLCEQGDVGYGMHWLVRALELTPTDNLGMDWTIRANLGAWQNELSHLTEVLPNGPDQRVTGLGIAKGNDMVVAMCRPTTGSGSSMCRVWSIRGNGKHVAQERRDVVGFGQSPDGRIVGLGFQDGRFELWDVTDLRFLGSAKSEEATTITTVAFDGSGNTMATGQKNVRLWDVATLTVKKGPLEHDGIVTRLALSSEGKSILTVTDNGATLRLWNATAAKLVGAWNHDRPIMQLGFSPDGTKAFAVELGGVVTILDVPAGTLIGSQIRHPGAGVARCSFSPDGSLIATGGGDNIVRLWDARTGEPRDTTFQHRGAVSDLEFSPDGRLLLVGSSDRTARLWETRTGNPVGSRIKHPHHVQAVAFSTDGSQFATACLDGAIRVWNVPRGATAGRILEHDHTVWDVAASDDGETIATVSGESLQPGVIRVWKGDSSDYLSIQLDSMTKTIALSPNGRTVAAGSWNGTVRIYDTRSGLQKGNTIQQPGAVYEIAFNRDGSLLLTAIESEAFARLWDMRSGKPVGKLHHASDAIRDSQFSLDGSLVLTGGYDQTIRLWNVNDRSAHGSPMPHQGAVGAVALSYDGTLAAAGNDFQVAQMWTTAEQKKHGPVLQHEGTVRAVAFSPDSNLLLTGSLDSTARLWATATAKRIGPPFRHDAEIEAAIFQADGGTVVTASWDNTVRVWHVPQPVDGSVERLRTWAEVISGIELFDREYRTLDENSWEQKRDTLRLPDSTAGTAL